VKKPTYRVEQLEPTPDVAGKRAGLSDPAPSPDGTLPPLASARGRETDTSGTTRATHRDIDLRSRIGGRIAGEAESLIHDRDSKFSAAGLCASCHQRVKQWATKLLL
jgi:hypothetical protein